MSPRKLTEDDKQEILQQYRNSEATTSTLAKSFEVSSSTISRFLKNKLSTTEYEDLIQQKRLARTPRGEKSSRESTAKKTKSASQKTKAKSQPKSQTKVLARDVEDNLELEEAKSSSPATDSQSPTTRRRRRRSTAAESVTEVIPDLTSETPAVMPESEVEQQSEQIISDQPPLVAETVPTKLVLDNKIRSKSELDEENYDKSSSAVAQRPILKGERTESDDEDDDEMDITILKEMLGEDLEDINDEEDEEDEDDWDDDDEASLPHKNSGLDDIEILPLSQASLPRICYLVIDRSAELIVKPLADFADLGIIPEAEVRQRTLPVFDNHRIAKRFSHRRERVIKVPDGRMLQKTSHHLQDKGITRLLIDGQVYSLSY